MEIIHAFILGVVEGITEFLPISSTGHLILTGELLGIPSTDFLKSFDIIIQFGAISAVLVLYWKYFLDLAVLKKIAAAFVPTGILGFALYKIVKTNLLGNEQVVLWALFLGGVGFIIFELWHRTRTQEALETDGIASISYGQAVLVGFCQAVAMIPGVSRSAATIFGGLVLGLRRKTVVEFSFLLAVPTMLAASAFDIARSASEFSVDQFWVLVVGFVTSLIVAALSIKFLLAYIKKRDFIAFGVYRIIVAIAFWVFVVF